MIEEHTNPAPAAAASLVTSPAVALQSGASPAVALQDGGAYPELVGKTGPEFWRSLEELSGTERFQDFLRREYPDQAEKMLEEPERRTVLKLMGASLGLAGLAACTKQPEERILPYAKNPESTTPGVPIYFATAMPWARGSIGILVENHQGRPTKIEGNELHPASRGASDAFTQSTVLELYDPDRSTTILKRGRFQTYDDFLTELRAELNVQSAKQGSGLALVMPTIVSPTLARQMREVREAFPRARIVQWDAIHRDEQKAGAVAAFGRDLVAQCDYTKAKVVLALDDDFLGGGPESVRSARDFAKGRKARKGRTALNRLYVVENSPSPTGMMADHRLPQRAEDIENFTRLLAKRLGIEVQTSASNPAQDTWIAAVAKDLQANAGASIVTVGAWQPAVVHQLVASINEKLGNVGKTLNYLPPVDCLPQEKGHVDALRELVEEMNGGKIELLLLLGVNPVYDAPADLDFKAAYVKVPLKVHHGLFLDETGILCEWHVPAAHFLESWGDARAADGTASIVQPLILPLFGGKSTTEIVNAVLNKGTESGYDAVRATWQKDRPDAFDVNWRRWLHDGVIPETAYAAVSATAKAVSAAPTASSTNVEVVFRPDPTVWDGRFANNGWLQELPKPATKLTWDNTVQMAPAFAARMGFATGDVVDVKHGGRTVRGPVWVSPGHADSSITLHLGYGRTRAGNVGNAAGFDVYALRTSAAAWKVSGPEITKVGESLPLASTQEHVDYDIVQKEVKKRQVLRVRDVENFAADPHSLDAADRLHHFPEHTDFYAKAVQREIAAGNRAVGDYQWGMVIDLSSCTACGACVTACQAENNIAVVGKDQVLRGREMHWLRIDRYFDGPEANPRIHSQPVPCMHCENAPCENVCPVGATQHSPEGLNEMVYNRCVGTRYCSNNCPYKVRRFNFLLYSDYVTETLKLQRNPDVTVRSRGVMEKCTYCVQRINVTRITAKREQRKIKDGEVVVACQQACPSECITFGDISDPKSAVSQLRAEPHEYGLIEELNTKPRTTYLAKIRNPNPELAELERA